MLSLVRLTCLLAVVGSSGLLHAQNVTQVSPTSAAVGTTLEIQGDGFGDTKPKVQLFDHETGKKYALKVVDFTPTLIHATISKAVVGDLELQVIVKGAAGPAVGPQEVSIEAPLVTTLSVPQAGPDGQVTINGDFFGIKKGKVRIGGQNAKVVSWAMQQIVLNMPKKLANGFWPIAVDNKLAIDDDATIEMIGSTQKVGKTTIDFAVDGKLVKFKYTPPIAPVPNIITFGGLAGSSPMQLLTVAVPYNYLNQTPPFTVTENTFNFGFIYVEQPKITSINDIGNPAKMPSAWVPTPGYPFSLSVNAESGGQIGASFSGTLKKQYGVNGPETVFVEGTIIVDL
jgi:hypothetical protein